MRFPNAPVAVTLSGEEWTAVLASLTLAQPHGLSPHGRKLHRHATEKLAVQLGEASNRCAAPAPSRPRLVSERRGQR